MAKNVTIVLDDDDVSFLLAGLRDLVRIHVRSLVTSDLDEQREIQILIDRNRRIDESIHQQTGVGA